MDLYIANASPRNHHLHYRIPENDRVFDRLIAAGSQVKLTYGQDATDHIINQLRPYGLISVKEIGRNKEFSGLCFSIDKPVDVEAIRNGLDEVDQIAIANALEVRKNGAIAADDAMEKVARQGGAQVNSVEIEVTEQSKGPSDTDAKFNQTIAVEREGRRPVGRPRRG